MTKFQANRIASITKCVPWKDSPQGTPQILAYHNRILRNEFIKLCIFREIVVVPVYADMEDLWLQESVTDINVRCSVWPREKSNSPRQDLLCCSRQTRSLTHTILLLMTQAAACFFVIILTARWLQLYDAERLMLIGILVDV